GERGPLGAPRGRRRARGPAPRLRRAAAAPRARSAPVTGEAAAPERRTRICVFCGSSPGTDPVFAQSALALGRAMVARGLELVYGGGSVGLMGIVADEILARKGVVRGVIPHSLFIREVGHRGL